MTEIGTSKVFSAFADSVRDGRQQANDVIDRVSGVLNGISPQDFRDANVPPGSLSIDGSLAYAGGGEGESHPGSATVAIGTWTTRDGREIVAASIKFKNGPTFVMHPDPLLDQHHTQKPSARDMITTGNRLEALCIQLDQQLTKLFE